LVEVEVRVADVLLEDLCRAGVEILLRRVEVDGGVEVLREVPGVPVARLRLAANGGGDNPDAGRLGRVREGDIGCPRGGGGGGGGGCPDEHVAACMHGRKVRWVNVGRDSEAVTFLLLERIMEA